MQCKCMGGGGGTGAASVANGLVPFWLPYGLVLEMELTSICIPCVRTDISKYRCTSLYGHGWLQESDIVDMSNAHLT
jgi:hypothetical protein